MSATAGVWGSSLFLFPLRSFFHFRRLSTSLLHPPSCSHLFILCTTAAPGNPQDNNRPQQSTEKTRLLQDVLDPADVSINNGPRCVAVHYRSGVWLPLDPGIVAEAPTTLLLWLLVFLIGV